MRPRLLPELTCFIKVPLIHLTRSYDTQAGTPPVEILLTQRLMQQGRLLLWQQLKRGHSILHSLHNCAEPPGEQGTKGEDLAKPGPVASAAPALFRYLQNTHSLRQLLVYLLADVWHKDQRHSIVQAQRRVLTQHLMRQLLHPALQGVRLLKASHFADALNQQGGTLVLTGTQGRLDGLHQHIVLLIPATCQPRYLT